MRSTDSREPKRTGPARTGDKKKAVDRQAAGGTVRVIERAMRLLKCLSTSSTGLTLTELSREVGLHKTTVLRFLKALQQGRFVSPGGSGKAWRLGSAFFDIGAKAVGQNDIRYVARPLMEEASRLTNETVQLAILADNSVVYIEKLEPPDLPLQINTQIGTRRPIHCIGLGETARGIP